MISVNDKLKQLDDLFTYDEIIKCKSPLNIFGKYKYLYKFDVKYDDDYNLWENDNILIPYNLTDDMKNNHVKLLLSLLFIIDTRQISELFKCLSNETYYISELSILTKEIKSNIPIGKYIAILLCGGTSKFRDSKLLLDILESNCPNTDLYKLRFYNLKDEKLYKNPKTYTKLFEQPLTFDVVSFFSHVRKDVKECLEQIYAKQKITHDMNELDGFIINCGISYTSIICNHFKNMNNLMSAPVTEIVNLAGMRKAKKILIAIGRENEINSVVPSIDQTTINNAMNIAISLANKIPDRESTNDDDDKSYICTICYVKKIDTLLLSCRHTFCHTCINNWIAKNNSEKTCPLCREKIAVKIKMIV